MMAKSHDKENTLIVHDVLPRSLSNGPGARFVIWTQGCSLGCPGCFNPLTHGINGGQGRPRTVQGLLEEIQLVATRIEGITISGGEPLEQPIPLETLLASIRKETPLGVILFSGFSVEEIETDPRRRAVLDHVDVLIAGRFDARHRVATGLRGSENKQIVLRTKRYSLSDFERVPTTEIVIDVDGKFTATGIVPIRMEKRVKGGNQ